MMNLTNILSISSAKSKYVIHLLERLSCTKLMSKRWREEIEKQTNYAFLATQSNPVTGMWALTSVLKHEDS